MKTAMPLCLCFFLAFSGLAYSQTQCDRTQVKETGVTDALLILITQSWRTRLPRSARPWRAC